MRWARLLRSSKPAPAPAAGPPAVDVAHLEVVDQVLVVAEDTYRRLLTLVDGLRHGSVPLTRAESLELRGVFIAYAGTFQGARDASTPLLAAGGDTAWIEHVDNLLSCAAVATQIAQALIGGMATGEETATRDELTALRTRFEEALQSCGDVRRMLAAVKGSA